VQDVNTISFYGIDHMEEMFKVLQLDKKAMTLESERLRMHFRRY